jgi:hypothetical protein
MVGLFQVTTIMLSHHFPYFSTFCYNMVSFLAMVQNELSHFHKHMGQMLDKKVYGKIEGYTF